MPESSEPSLPPDTDNGQTSGRPGHVYTLHDLFRGFGILAVFFGLMGLGYLPALEKGEKLAAGRYRMATLMAAGVALQVIAVYIPERSGGAKRSRARRITGWGLIYLSAFFLGSGGMVPGLLVLGIGLFLLSRRKNAPPKTDNRDA